MRVLSIVLALILSACGNAPSGVGAASSTATTASSATPASTVTPSTTPTQIGLSLSKTSIKTDNADSTTITAVVLDAGNAAVQNATVNFTATGGQLSAASAVTDVTGKATTVLTSGLLKSNQTATVTGTVSGVTPTLSSQVPVQMSGTTIGLSSGTSTNVTPTTVDRVTATILDAANVPVFNIPVTFTQSGAGSITISPLAASTDANGQIQADVYGATTGSVTLTATGAGATATQAYTATGTGIAFAITAPAVDTYALSANANITVNVSVPASISSITFVTSLGKWNGVSAVQTVVPANNAASAIFSSANAGIATVQVYDTNNPISIVRTSIAVSQPSSQASQISLQSNVNVVAVSTGNIQNSADLTATVRSASGQAVGGAAVAFSMPSPPGGATLSSVVVITDSLGQAKTTFTSGAVSTGGQGVDIYASVLGKAITAAKNNIVVGGTAGSIAIGRSNLIVVQSSTVYEVPMSILVADGNGNAVANASVTLKAFPSKFRIGKWVDQDPSLTVQNFHACVSGEFSNEDVNKNGILDILPSSEDLPHTTTTTVCDPYNTLTGTTYASNGLLDPPNSAAGTVPATVTTDASGIANFNLTYLKSSADWIIDEITAKTLVLGTETTSRITFRLPAELTEAESGTLPNSSFGQ